MTIDENNPLCTIVTPVLNRADTIAASISSVRAQTYPNIEHIVVDGGSTDGTLDVIRSFDGHPGFRWISEPDGGMYEAINKGMKLARGEVLAYLNSDDLYLPWSVDVAVSKLTEGGDAVFGDLGLLEKTENGVAFSPVFYPSFDLNFITHFGTLAQPTVFWTAELAKSIGSFDTDFRLLGDCEYWLRAGANGARFDHVNEILALQVNHEETLRNTQPERMIHEFHKLREHYAVIAGPPANRRVTRVRRAARARTYLSLFLISGFLPHPRMWPQFMQFRRELGARFDGSGFLKQFLIPQALRPGASLLRGDLILRRGSTHPDGARSAHGD